MVSKTVKRSCVPQSHFQISGPPLIQPRQYIRSRRLGDNGSGSDRGYQGPQ
jgi:methionyl aminopeptidase